MGKHVTIYEGPSIDGKPIAVVVCMGSGNNKTGNLATLNVIPQTMSPLRAVQEGKDNITCLNCAKRPKNYNKRFDLQVTKARKRGLSKAKAEALVKDKGLAGNKCYVTLVHSPNIAYREYSQGKAPFVSVSRFIEIMDYEGLTALRNAGWGDAGVIPRHILEPYLVAVEQAGYDNIGYSEQWIAKRSQWLKRYCMASIDNPKQYMMAKRLGWKTFRVIQPGDFVSESEYFCPASDEAGKLVKCINCTGRYGGCNPLQVSKDVVILNHGPGSIARKLVTKASKAKRPRKETAAMLMSLHNSRRLAFKKAWQEANPTKEETMATA